MRLIARQVGSPGLSVAGGRHRPASGGGSFFAARKRFHCRVVGLVSVVALSTLALLMFLLSSSSYRGGAPSEAEAQRKAMLANEVGLRSGFRDAPEPDGATAVDAWDTSSSTSSDDVAAIQQGGASINSGSGANAPGSRRPSVPNEKTFQQLTLAASGCKAFIGANRSAKVGDVGVRFLNVPIARTLEIKRSHRSAPAAVQHNVVEFFPQFSAQDRRYFPTDALVEPAGCVPDNITLLTDSMRLVAAATKGSTDAVDARVVCDADDVEHPSRLAWGYDLGKEGYASVGVGFGEGIDHRGQTDDSAIHATVRFPKRSRIALFGLASRGSDIRIPAEDEVQLKNLDVNHYALDRHANLYGSVPLVYAVDLEHPSFYTFGLLWLNGAAMHIRTTKQAHNDGVEQLFFYSAGGAGKLYMLPGPTTRDVLYQYFSLTGAPMLPPLFGIGYHQCRWSYRDQADVLGVNDNFDMHAIPADAIWLDIDHTNDRRYFTWNGQLFPDSKSMIAHLKASGRKLVTITDPHIKVDPRYFVYLGAHTKKFFVSKSMHSDDEFHGHCWPGESAWIDFANPKAREWYATLFDPEVYAGSTLDVFSWNDMNEPSVFSGPEITMPMDAGQYDGVQRYDHRQLHNMYGFHHTAATYSGHLYRSHYTQRPFLLTRAFFAGSQRFAAVWTGDNQAQWSHLKGSVTMLLMHSLSGIPFIGADVGGFFDDPEEELHVRWYHLGALYPFFRGHSHEQTRRREPWLYPEAIHKNIAAAIRLRYTLLPYLYTTFFESNYAGTSIWRPRMMEFPSEEASYTNVDSEESVLVGASLLAIPALHRGQTTVSTVIPQGASFVDWWSGEAYPAGTHAHFVVPSVREYHADRPVLPLCLRAGHGIPTLASVENVRSSASLFDPSAGALRLVMALDAQCGASGHVYLDDGTTTSTQFCLSCIMAHVVSANRTSTVAIRMSSEANTCNFRSTILRTSNACKRNWPADTPLLFQRVRSVRLLTKLCPRLDEGASFARTLRLRSLQHDGDAGHVNTTLTDVEAERMWAVRKVADHVYEASGSDLTHIDWEMTWTTV